MHDHTRVRTLVLPALVQHQGYLMSKHQQELSASTDLAARMPAEHTALGHINQSLPDRLVITDDGDDDYDEEERLRRRRR